MMGHKASPQVISAAGGESNDDPYGFAFVKWILGMPGRAIQKRENDNA
jgi:hypothetical protein